LVTTTTTTTKEDGGHVSVFVVNLSARRCNAALSLGHPPGAPRETTAGHKFRAAWAKVKRFVVRGVLFSGRFVSVLKNVRAKNRLRRRPDLAHA